MIACHWLLQSGVDFNVSLYFTIITCIHVIHNYGTVRMCPPVDKHYSHVQIGDIKPIQSVYDINSYTYCAISEWALSTSISTRILHAYTQLAYALKATVPTSSIATEASCSLAAQGNYTLLCSSTTCLFKSVFRTKSFWQWLHANGLSPVWLNIWSLKAGLDLNDLSHTVHWKARSSLWLRMW